MLNLKRLKNGFDMKFKTLNGALREWIRKHKGSTLSRYNINELEQIYKTFIVRLKVGCVICGKKLVGLYEGQRGRPNKTQICDSCKCVVKPHSSSELKKRLFKKIDKIVG